VLSNSIMLNSCWILIFLVLLLNFKFWCIVVEFYVMVHCVELWMMIYCCWLMKELIVGEKDSGCWILLLLKFKKFMFGSIKSISRNVSGPNSRSNSRFNSWSSSKWSSKHIGFYLSDHGELRFEENNFDIWEACEHLKELIEQISYKICLLLYGSLVFLVRSNP
jgi:hypothetical protein